jgi:predicted transposase YdaD
MRESPLYQEIIQTGMQQGQQRIVIRQLTRRIGEVSPQLQAQIQSLSTSQIE